MDLISSSGAEKGDVVSEVREYRKGNWSAEETAVLMEAKKMEEERRRMKRGKAAEPQLRWKWVEDYCWRRGCFRSQNQCNDKWDNVMRDFKKVREYEEREGGYWGALDKTQRKEKGLPLNMLPEIYQALMDLKLTEKKKSTTPLLGQQPPPPPAADQPTFAFPHPLPTVAVDSDRSESESRAKRRKREGTSGAASGTSSLEDIGSAISKSAKIIAEAIESNEERAGRREKEMMGLHQRRLQIEESKAEIHRRGINSLVDAINKLADSIFALAHQQHSSK